MDKKPWYEKIYIWIGIIAGIFGILGISIFGGISLSNNNPNDSVTNFENNEFGDQSPVFTGVGDNKVVYNNNYYTNDLNEQTIFQEDEILENSASININDVSLNYAIATDERFENVFLIDYPDFTEYTDLSVKSDKYFIEDNCVTILNISNNSDHEIKLNKFRVIAEDILPNLEPIILTYLHSGSSVDMEIQNDGWSDIHNLKINITDEDGILSEYYNEEDLQFEIPYLKSGDSITMHILDKELMKKIPNHVEIPIFPIANILSDELKDSQKLKPIYITYEGICVAFYGATGNGVYGITIKTNENYFMKEFSINESIDSDDILDIPLCFFPDKSCDMEFYVEFDIYNGYTIETIKSETRQLSFKVSSIYSKYINMDESTINLKEVYKEGKYFDYVTFPYAK